MVSWLFIFIEFCIVLFLYLHIQFQFKTNNDLEILEVSSASKEILEDICLLKQPVVFHHLDKQKSIPGLEQWTQSFFSQQGKIHGMGTIKVRNVHDEINDKDPLYIPLPFATTLHLFQQDTTSSYYTEQNEDFLFDIGLKSILQKDSFFRPPFVSKCHYDILSGSSHTTTPLRYHMNYRHFLYINQGIIHLKLSPPSSSKYLDTITDYEHFEFRSLYNPWLQHKDEQIHCLDITLYPGQYFYLPPYWWYSIQFENQTLITSLSYNTYANHIAILPHSLLYFLQIQNIQHKKYSSSSLSSETSEKEYLHSLVNKEKEENEKEYTTMDDIKEKENNEEEEDQEEEITGTTSLQDIIQVEVPVFQDID